MAPNLFEEPEEVEWSGIPLPKILSAWNDLDEKERNEVWGRLPESGRDRVKLSLKARNHLEGKEEDSSSYYTTNYKTSKRQSQRGSNDQRIEGDEEDSNEVSKIESELTRIHRDRIEQELSLIRGQLEEYISVSNKRAQKRRAENINVLVAIGIVTGFFTIYPNLEISSGLFDILSTGIAIAAVVFLFMKLNAVGVGNFKEVNIPTEIDRFADILFQFAISGAFLVGIFGGVVRVFEIEINPESLATPVAIGLASLIYSIFINMKYLTRTNEEQGEVHLTEIKDELFELSMADEDMDEKIDDFLDNLEVFKDTVNSTGPLNTAKKHAEQMKGLTENQKRKIQNKLDNLIESKTKETKTEKELQEMRISEIEEKREKLRNRLSDYLN